MVAMHRLSLILAKRRNPEILDSIGSQDNMGAAPFYPCILRPVLLSWKCPKTAPCFFHHPQEFVSLVGRLPFYVVKNAALIKFWNSKVFYPWLWWREGEGGKGFSNNVKKTALLVPDGFPQGHPTIKKRLFLNFLNHCEENVHIWHKMLKIINYQSSPQKV